MFWKNLKVPYLTFIYLCMFNYSILVFYHYHYLQFKYHFGMSSTQIYIMSILRGQFLSNWPPQNIPWIQTLINAIMQYVCSVILQCFFKTEELNYCNIFVKRVLQFASKVTKNIWNWHIYQKFVFMFLNVNECQTFFSFFF